MQHKVIGTAMAQNFYWRATQLLASSPLLFFTMHKQRDTRTNRQKLEKQGLVFTAGVIVYMHGNKSTLERVANHMYCCINGVFRELHHDSVMNII